MRRNDSPPGPFTCSQSLRNKDSARVNGLIRGINQAEKKNSVNKKDGSD